MSTGDLINFARKSLKVQIKTDSLCVDGYEVDNLIEDDPAKCNFFQKKHFMAEYYVKCPVTIVLCFPCLFDISAIVIGPRVSSNHCTKCFEIFTAYQRPIINPSGTSLPCKYPVDLSIQPTHALFNFVGKFNERFNGANLGTVVFQNEQHPVFYQQQFSQDCASISMKPFVSTRSCSHLLIKITYASLPVVKHLEVWGTISSRNPPTLSNAVKKMISTLARVSKENQLIKHEGNFSNSKTSSSVSEKPLEVNTNHEKQIPEEFLDPITYDIMTYPLLLPSGKNIDKTTYEKFISEESKLGRVPCDPFTGVAFHDGKQPIPNMTLKFRIDHFLMKNPECPAVLFNAVGTKAKPSSLLEKVQSNVAVSSKSVKLQSHELFKRKPYNDTQISSKKMKGKDASHQSELSDSLDSALSKTILSLPLSKSRETQERTKCEKCGVTDKSLLYKLPCLHCYCKTCVSVLVKDKKCTQCCKYFEKLDVVKVCAIKNVSKLEQANLQHQQEKHLSKIIEFTKLLQYSRQENSTELMKKCFGFYIEKEKSKLEEAGNGVFVRGGIVPMLSIVAFYPGTVYYPMEPIFFQSICNPFILKCLDGVLIDGNNTLLSKRIFRSCAQRDRIGPYMPCDTSWLTSKMKNPLAVGQFVNNETPLCPANVIYQELDIPITFPHSLMRHIPNVNFSPRLQHFDGESNDGGGFLVRTVILIALRDISEGEELYSSYFTQVQTVT